MWDFFNHVVVDPNAQALSGYRGIYDFADLDNSRFAMPLGQSGNLLSPWARNFVAGWQNLSYIEITGTRAELGRTAVGTITLSPPARH